MWKDSLGLRAQVDRHDVVIEELQRRVLQLKRKFLEQCARRVSRPSMRFAEAISQGIVEAKKEAEDAKSEAAKLQEDALSTRLKSSMIVQSVMSHWLFKSVD